VRILPICAILVVTLYIITLLPFSGFLGGFLFIFLMSWAGPSLVNVLLAGWCSLFVKSTILIRAVCFVSFSLVLGINTSFPALISRLSYTPDTSTEIQRSVAINSNTKTDFWLHLSRIAVAADPLSSSFDAQGDEGCGCMYFVFNEPANYLWQLDRFLRKSIQSHSMMDVNYSVTPRLLTGGVHFDVQLVQDPQARDTANLSLDVYDGAEKTASLSRRGIPYDAAVEQRIGRERGLLNGYFLQNCASMLLHDNFWTYLLRDFVSYVPRASVRDFLAKAAPIT
jgi:hypothetical protein